MTDSVAAANFHNHLQSGASSMEAPYEYASRFKSSHEIERGKSPRKWTLDMKWKGGREKQKKKRRRYRGILGKIIVDPGPKMERGS